MKEQALIPAISIEMKKVTGRIDKLFEKMLTRDDHGEHLWEQADLLLAVWSYGVECGYDDVDFTVCFADGKEYQGTIELSPRSEGRPETLAGHIRTHCLCYSGQQKPWEWPEERYQEFMKMFKEKDKAYCRNVLDHYQLG